MKEIFNSNFYKNCLIITLSLIAGSCNTPTKNNLSAKEIYSLTVNNTVTVTTEKGLGSGFFIDSNIIVTNYHVIEGVESAFVVLNNSEVKYPVIGFIGVDQINDLILLKIEYKNNNYIELAENMPQPGEKVFAIGSPVGLSKTISDGLISGIRNFQNKKLLQITAPISHGSSGCPIINDRGQLVGVAVSGIDDASNIGFCIPSNLIKTLFDFKQDFASQLKNLHNLPDHQNGKSNVPDVNSTPENEKPKEIKRPTKSNIDEGWLFLQQLQKKPYEEQLQIIDNLISNEPNNYLGYLARADKLWISKGGTNGLEDLNKAISLNPSGPQG